MLTAQWQEEIESLKKELADEIAAIGISDMTVPNHICINNLKSKLVQILIELFLIRQRKRSYFLLLGLSQLGYLLCQSLLG